MEKKVLIFGEKGIIKNSFHKSKQRINIDKVGIKAQFSLVKHHMVKEVYLNTLWDI